MIEQPFSGTPLFESIGKTFDSYAHEPVEMATVRERKERIPKEVFYIPAIILLALVIWSQRRRSAKETFNV